MDKIYDHKKIEEKIYQNWEEKGYFSPEINPNGKPYSIILPPPNANAPLHFGHAMYVIEDILIRYHRMKGFKALWLPGADHAGFETQFVFEKKLQEMGKSRFDFDRETLHQMIWDFVQKNRPIMESQLRKLGFSLDWTRKKFTLDEDIINAVYKTFKDLYIRNLLYRAKRLVNYCTFDGTSFSDLEVIYEEKESKLFFIKYPFVDNSGFITVATTRPETMLGDAAVAINPNDKRYKKLVGKFVILPLIKRKIPIITDKTIDMEFGTGAVKITPAHDPNDFEIGQKHNLGQITVIGFDGKMTKEAGEFEGLYAKQARAKIVEKLKEIDLLEKEELIKNQVPICYKCKNPIEPLLKNQWFVRMEPLAKEAIKASKAGKIKIYPKNFEKIYLQFLSEIKDWNISRQVVWGIRIPAWYCKDCKTWLVTNGEKPSQCKCGSERLEQDKDTFDTWFSSSQWPFATLKTNKEGDFEEFYPTSVMETGYDILKWWVARMVMIGLFETNKAPFKNVVLHGLVKDPLGKKMSKSKNNAIDPLELVDKYGADAVRFALVYGTAFGNDQSLSYPKLQAMRNFTNKLWNMGRFIDINRVQGPGFRFIDLHNLKAENENDTKMIQKTEKLATEITSLLDKYDFNHAAQKLYNFAWHEFADKYIEDVKNRIDENSFLILNSLFLILLKLIHPFMPFVTEEIFKTLWGSDQGLIIQAWPKDR